MLRGRALFLGGVTTALLAWPGGASGQLVGTTAARPLGHSAPAPQVFTSDGYPGIESSVTWSVVRFPSLGAANEISEGLGGPSISSISKAGFNVAVTGNTNAWFGVTFEGGGTFLKQDVPGLEGLLVVFELQEWTMLAGPKFTLRRVGVVEPFFQLLAGAAYLSGEIPSQALQGTNWDFALQPGIGLDVVASDTVAVRLGFDGRVLSQKAFSGRTINQFRFTLGITFRSALR